MTRELQQKINEGFGALHMAQCIVDADASQCTKREFLVASAYLKKRDAALMSCPVDEDECIISTSEELDALLDPIDAEFLATSVLEQPTDSDYRLPEHIPGAEYAIQDQGGLLGHNVRSEEVPSPEGYYFQQFVNGNPREGYFGPYINVSDMPQFVLANPMK